MLYLCRRTGTSAAVTLGTIGGCASVRDGVCRGSVTCPPSPLFSTALQCQKQRLTRLYTSYHAGRLFPTQLALRKKVLTDGWRRHGRGGTPSSGAGDAELGGVHQHHQPPHAPPAPTWEQADSTDIMHVNASSSTDEKQPLQTHMARVNAKGRPYFPLGETAKLELQGDYLTEGGLHQEALEHYGVVAKAYDLAYPENHPQRMGIRIKLSGALRRTGRLESSKHNLLQALAMAEQWPSPHLELIVEALLELGLTQEALNDSEAGTTFEEAVQVIQQFHDFGASHKMLRLLPRLSRRFNLNFEEKFLYYSPFDWDRTYALADQCLHRATAFYRKNGNQDGVIRVLHTRVQLLDKKFFNMRDFAGRIHTMRGHWMRRAQPLTDAPTPDDLLRYSPTIHQVHRDFKYELNAPIGRENEVASGTNRVVMDMGNPYRRRGRYAKEMMRDADYNFAKYTRKREFGDKI